MRYRVFEAGQKLAPKWDELGKHFKGSEDIVIAKMDATANEVEEVTVEGFPTLKLIRKGSNEIVDYNGKKQFFWAKTTVTNKQKALKVL